MLQVLQKNKLFLLISLFSFFVSLSLVFGRIDQDFFSFYYVGRGVSRGMDVYVDFADNKGPVLYLFFAMLNVMFSNNYLVALVISSTIIDAIAVLFFIKVF